jgi:hypothetical protein
MAREQIACVERARSAATACTSRTRWRSGALTGGSVVAGRRQGDTGELAGPQGGRRARLSGVELTRAAARRRGGGGCFGRQRSSTGRELR